MVILAVFEREGRAMSARSQVWKLIEMILLLIPRPPAHVLLYGPSGVGKSCAGLTFGIHPDRPPLVLNMTEDTTAAEIRGHYGLKNGTFEFLAGPMLIGWLRGARVVVNEIEKCGSDALAAMLGFADDVEVAVQTLPDGTTVRPSEGFHIVATSNAPPEALEPALRDRFPIAIHVNTLHPAALASLPPELRELAANSSMIDDPERRVGFRSVLSFERLSHEIGREMAARAVFGERSGDVLAALRIAGLD
jgi:MoxR-like ATPase